MPYEPEDGSSTLGIEALGSRVSSGESSQAFEKSMWAASDTDLSSVLGRNMLTLVRKFSTNEVVFSICAAVEMRLKEQTR